MCPDHTDHPGPPDLSHSALDIRFADGPGLALERIGLPGAATTVTGGTAFGIRTGAGWFDGSGVVVEDCTIEEKRSAAGASVIEHVVRTRATSQDLRVDWHVTSYPGHPVVELHAVARNDGERQVVVERLDSFVVDLPAAAYDLSSFSADGSCREFAPRSGPLEIPELLQSLSGRSSHGDHPYFALRAPHGGGHLVGCVAWSGNWVVRFDSGPTGDVRVSGGLHDEGFGKRLAPGEELAGPRVVLAFGGDELSTIAAALTDVGRQHWYPEVAADFPPTEWNHWWPYVDTIDEKTFLANVDAAAELGLELCTLDAGWYGAPDVDAAWYTHRGDWDTVNDARFPSGIRSLADHVHSRGMRFGLWCEIEGLGTHARTAAQRPDLPATRADKPLGYVCLANPAARAWATATLERLITEYACDWIKLDFNVDPGLGCDRTDHGHDAGDGLFEHYRGYYRMLDEIRARHPQVILENCSSGGLRIDLEIARHTHQSYISDPDWPEHSLQVFWAAAASLAPERCLHWAYSQWWDPTALPHQRFDPHDPDLTAARLDYYVRIAMLHGFGLSQKLPDLPSWVAERYSTHIRLYKDVVRRFVRTAHVLALTGQPRREGEGDRWAAFQYAMPDDAEHLLFVFRLDGGEPSRTLHPRRLDPTASYAVRSLATGREARASGADLLADGLRFDGLAEEEADLLQITVVAPSF